MYNLRVKEDTGLPQPDPRSKQVVWSSVRVMVDGQVLCPHPVFIVSTGMAIERGSPVRCVPPHLQAFPITVHCSDVYEQQGSLLVPGKQRIQQCQMSTGREWRHKDGREVLLVF